MSSPPDTDTDAEEAVADVITEVIDEVMRTVIIPHCAVCVRPCCSLEDVVLELDWKRTQALYQIGGTKKDFDKQLPSHIRMQGGHYFAHGKPCPAYDVVTRRCGVYDTDTKPDECTDFPFYEDGDAVTADRRCEAVDVDAIEALLRAKLPGLRVTRAPDPQFPELVTFDVEGADS